MTNVCFLSAIFFQVYIYCHGGAVLTFEVKNLINIEINYLLYYSFELFIKYLPKGLNVADATYASTWYENTPFARKTILYSMMRSQKPIIIRAGYFEANLVTFTSVNYYKC